MEENVQVSNSAQIAQNDLLGEGWNLCSEVLPDKKPDWNHSAQCLVWYAGVPNDKVAGYGIAYYHYSPPFKTEGEWIDFAHYGRQPIAWKHIQPPSFA